jgi:hypothetical protein
MKMEKHDPSKGSHSEWVAAIGTHVVSSSNSNEKGGGSVSVKGIGAGIGGGKHTEVSSHYVRREQCPYCCRMLPK